MNSVYIHIPFCKSICSYCDFCKMYLNDNYTKKYLDALKSEIEEKYQGEEIKTLYIGGGTPSALNFDDLKDLLEITKIFNLSKLEEFTFECNLNDIDKYKLALLKIYNVNRLSIGIESFNKDNLKFMKRNHTFEEAKEKIKLCRELGFDNINIDLIYGIPKESVNTLKKDIKQVLELNVEHISTYSLIIEDNTMIGIEQLIPIDEETDEEMYNTICEKLQKSGYKHYEISNFAKEGYESKHNINYWLNNNYYGFGLSAHGYIGNIRYENTRNINKYINHNYVKEEQLISTKDDMDNTIMLGFRLIDGINLQDFFNRYEINLQEAYDIKKLLEEKKLIYENGYLKINPKYIYVENEILIQII